jgi:hypothetical protein
MKRAELYTLIDQSLAEGGQDALSGVRLLRDELLWTERRAVQNTELDDEVVGW